jgi:hypothetical protein
MLSHLWIQIIELLKKKFYKSGKDAIKEKKVGGMQTTLTDLETYTSYYVRVTAFTKERNAMGATELFITIKA